MMGKVSEAYKSASSQASWCRILSIVAVVVVCAVAAKTLFLPSSSSSSATEDVSSSLSSTASAGPVLRASTWNVAAVNNNPFEYWITNDDPSYNALMKSVSDFIEAPGDKDITVKEVFTPAMFDELAATMESVGWTGVAETKEYWTNDFMNRKIIEGFVKDDLLGKKRLASMPDRVTNTIHTADDSSVMRPTVINCYNGELNSVEQWWPQWLEFYFNKQISVKKSGALKTTKIYEMIPKISKAKYPSITEAEEAVSIPLETMCMAIFDAILVHMMGVVGKTTWQPLRKDMCEKLNLKKNDRTVEIMANTYGDSDIQFLQEVAGNFKSFSADKKIAQMYDIVATSTMDTERDQNSFILLKKGEFQDVTEVTDKVADCYSEMHDGAKIPVVNGDLVVITAISVKDDTKYLFASFHGDTNGLATKPVVSAVHGYAVKYQPDSKLLFGMDANTYSKPEKDQQGVVDFAQFYTGLKLNSCYGHTPNPMNFTTFHARTHLQTQLNKAVSLEEKDIKGDKNPKDFIVFFDADYKVLSTSKDNTGKKKYIEGMVFPTLTFPSDHGVTSTVLLSTAPAPTPAQKRSLKGPRF